MGTNNTYFTHVENNLPRIIESLEKDVASTKMSPEEKVQLFLDLERAKGMWEIFQRFKKSGYLKYD